MIRTLRIIALAVLLTLSASYPPGLRAQQKGFTVQGVVTDTEGESLIGVFISVKGTKTGTTTDLDGLDLTAIAEQIYAPVQNTP